MLDYRLTKSNDGIRRVTVRASCRLDSKRFGELEAAARYFGIVDNKEFQKLLDERLREAIDHLIASYHEETRSDRK